MNFKKCSFKFWLMNEGKAMNVSKDMSNFAKEAVEILKKKQWQFDQTIHQRTVESNYGKKDVAVKTKIKFNNGPDGDAVAKSGKIRIFLPGRANPEYIPTSIEIGDNGLPIIKSQGTTGISSQIPNYDINFDEYYYVIIHELVHIFDPKITSRPEWMKKYDAHSTIQDYYTSPHEQDAWMAHRAREVVDHYMSQYKGDKNEVKKIISNLSHDTEPESTWYKYPKIWKKYLNTLYHVLQSK